VSAPANTLEAKLSANLLEDLLSTAHCDAGHSVAPTPPPTSRCTRSIHIPSASGNVTTCGTGPSRVKKPSPLASMPQVKRCLASTAISWPGSANASGTQRCCPLLVSSSKSNRVLPAISRGITFGMSKLSRSPALSGASAARGGQRPNAGAGQPSRHGAPFGLARRVPSTRTPLGAARTSIKSAPSRSLRPIAEAM
jgi:hypothetical protein